MKGSRQYLQNVCYHMLYFTERDKEFLLILFWVWQLRFSRSLSLCIWNKEFSTAKDILQSMQDIRFGWQFAMIANAYLSWALEPWPAFFATLSILFSATFLISSKDIFPLENVTTNDKRSHTKREQTALSWCLLDGLDHNDHQTRMWMMEIALVNIWNEWSRETDTVKKTRVWILAISATVRQKRFPLPSLGWLLTPISRLLWIWALFCILQELPKLLMPAFKIDWAHGATSMKCRLKCRADSQNPKMKVTNQQYLISSISCHPSDCSTPGYKAFCLFSVNSYLIKPSEIEHRQAKGIGKAVPPARPICPSQSHIPFCYCPSSHLQKSSRNII